jgi:hypothetical protein
MRCEPPQQFLAGEPARAGDADSNGLSRRCTRRRPGLFGD